MWGLRPRAIIRRTIHRQRAGLQFYVRPRSIAMLGNRRATIRVAPLVLTASDKDSWGESNRNLIVKYDDLLDRPGPVPIAFVIWEQKGKEMMPLTRAWPSLRTRIF